MIMDISVGRRGCPVYITYRMSERVLLDSELGERGDGIIVTVLAKTLVLKVDHCYWVLAYTERERSRMLLA